MTSTPLFLYYAPHLVHTPLELPEANLTLFDFIDDDDRRQTYSAMVKYLDNIIGELVHLLKAKNMWDNTLLVVSSDNGGQQFAGNNYPLKQWRSQGMAECGSCHTNLYMIIRYFELV